jgi:hypothetical protein
VTTPSGQTYSTGSRAGAAVGPYGGVRAGASRGAVTSGPYGTASAGYRGGVAVGPYGGVAAGSRAYAHRTNYVSSATLATRGGYVRTGYAYPYFGRSWVGAHPLRWAPARWAAASYWATPAWTTVGPWCGITAEPIVYDYGSSVVIDDNNVYVNGDTVATSEDYATQAATFADTGREAKVADADEWQPLGVFGLVREDATVAQNIFQLGVNKAGVIRGNYYDAVADNTMEVYGSVDPKSQRAAWSVGNNKSVVFETGLGNLTQDQTTVLVHYGKERTEQMLLVRLEEPKDGK